MTISQPPTLANYLKVAGVNVTPAAAPAAPAQPAKAASTPAPAQPAKAASTPAPAAPAAPAKTADVIYNPEVIKTAEQKWLLENGIVCPDQAKAASLYATMSKSAQAHKQAEVNKFAAEMEARGTLMFHGMTKESTAMRLADGDATMVEVLKVAAWVGCTAADIIKRANELKKLAELAAASPESAFFGSERGSAARTGDSEVLSAAERNQNTTYFEPATVAGTRPATRGIDQKELRFSDTVTMPNNPGLNHGQQTDNGKGMA